MPLVALVPRWRQDYPDNLTQEPEAMTAETGHGLNRYRDSAHFEVSSQLIGQP